MRPALLLIDFQDDYLRGPCLAPPREGLISSAARVLAGFRQASAPVFHVVTSVGEAGASLPHWQAQGLVRCRPGTSGHATPGPLVPSPLEPVFHKRWYSGCEDPELVATLHSAGVGTVYLCGVHLRACVRHTATDLAQAGFEVVLVDEACGDDDPIHGILARDWLVTRFCRAVSVAATLQAVSANHPHETTADRGASSPAAQASGTGLLEWPWHHSPATGAPLFQVELQRETQIRAATQHGRERGDDWRRVPLVERLQVVRNVTDAVARESEHFARMITRETGKPIVDARLEVGFGVALLRDAAERVGKGVPGESGPGWQLVRRPHGTVAVITPWNNPLAIPLGKIIPAILHGNAVAWKPAPAGTGVARALGTLFEDHGVPSGLVSLITGDRRTAELLIAAPGIDAVTLTGSETAGLACQLACLRRAIPFQGELGGNNGAIVWDPLDWEAALLQTARGAFGAAGQRCTANRRLIVPREELPRVLDRLVELTRTLPWGDPEREETVVGPVIGDEARVRLEALLERVRQAGHRLVVPWGSARPAAPADPRGAYISPALVVCEDSQAEVVQEESFGPLLVIQPADSWHDALRLCDGVRQGLVAALWSGTPERQREFLDRVRVGMAKLNQSTAGATAAAPFGGWKHSGVGPFEHGLADLEFYTRHQTVYGPVASPLNGRGPQA